jgi:hypothetical protein
METESAEIDFRSLEDELYDNEITQILTQPNTTESLYSNLYFDTQQISQRSILCIFLAFYTVIKCEPRRLPDLIVNTKGEISTLILNTVVT